MLITRLPAAIVMYFPCVFLLGSCSAEHYSRKADTVTTQILNHRERIVTQERLDSIQRPTLLPTPDPEEADSSLAKMAVAPSVDPHVLSLPEALEIAVNGNRDQLRRLETLYLQALSLRGTRFQFAPQIDLSLNYLFSDRDELSSSRSLGVNGGVSQIMPWGGNIALNVNGDYNEVDSAGLFSTSAGITLTQPLLRGSGAAISHELLIQAERSLVYALRDFELARESFSIDVAARFYSLVQSGRTIDNLETNLKGFVFNRRQAEALYEVGRATELDVLRARRSELNSMDSLISAQENRMLSLDRFRVFLGLPRDHPVEVQPEAPEFLAADYDVAQAIEMALVNRLDLLNQTQRLEDVYRGLRISRDNLRGDLTLTAGVGVSSPQQGSFTDQKFGRDAFTAGLNMSLPVNRVLEANSYRRAEINARRAERGLDQFRDELVIGIRSSFRELARRKQSLDIQAELVRGQEKNVRIAQLRFDRGGVDNRDVTEANDSLLQARNRMIDERVNYEISRLNLLMSLGVLFIDEKGMFQE